MDDRQKDAFATVFAAGYTTAVKRLAEVGMKWTAEPMTGVEDVPRMQAAKYMLPMLLDLQNDIDNEIAEAWKHFNAMHVGYQPTDTTDIN